MHLDAYPGPDAPEETNSGAPDATHPSSPDPPHPPPLTAHKPVGVVHGTVVQTSMGPLTGISSGAVWCFGVFQRALAAAASSSFLSAALLIWVLSFLLTPQVQQGIWDRLADIPILGNFVRLSWMAIDWCDAAFRLRLNAHVPGTLRSLWESLPTEKEMKVLWGFLGGLKAALR